VDNAACRREVKNILQMPPVPRRWDSKLQWEVIKENVKLSPLEVDSMQERGKLSPTHNYPWNVELRKL
jgi:hypothetical protein